jgi:hypothetical protein
VDEPIVNYDFSKVISTILKHDRRQTSYKLALVRALNDVVLSFPDLWISKQPVAIPLRILAEFWLAYYWPFCDPNSPIWQGVRVVGRSDIEFREPLAQLRQEWQTSLGGADSPADGYFLISELRVPRNRGRYNPVLLDYFKNALRAVLASIRQPITFSGSGDQKIFMRPTLFRNLQETAAIPGTQANDYCLLIEAGLWQAFHSLSLWIEALCIHEWCLFSERVQPKDGLDRGSVYKLLTTRPGNRRPLTWERNEIDLLLMEGYSFTCPWTEKRIIRSNEYDLDHLLPLAVYPINEVWNLIPADPDFNSHHKRDRLPSSERLLRAEQPLRNAYELYERSRGLNVALHEDVALRFLQISSADFVQGLTSAVISFLTSVAESRNIARF